MANQSRRLEPAASVIAILGGAGQVARGIGLARKEVWRWAVPKERGGRGGYVPARYQAALLIWAEREGLPLTADMIIRGVPSARRARSSGRVGSKVA